MQHLCLVAMSMNLLPHACVMLFTSHLNRLKHVTEINPKQRHVNRRFFKQNSRYVVLLNTAFGINSIAIRFKIIIRHVAFFFHAIVCCQFFTPFHSARLSGALQLVEVGGVNSKIGRKSLGRGEVKNSQAVIFQQRNPRYVSRGGGTCYLWRVQSLWRRTDRLQNVT